MSRMMLVYITFFLGVAFMFTPRGPMIGFPFSGQMVHTETYAYYLWEHLIKIVLFWIVYAESVKYEKFFSFMFWFQVADVFDYILTYNGEWITIYDVPITINVIGCLMAGILLLKYVLKK